MANNYFDGTGVLVLRKVTPVIRALFLDFALDEEHPGPGEVYIARLSEETSISWADIETRLGDLVRELKLELHGDAVPAIDEFLYALASHFGADGDYDLGNLIGNGDFDENAAVELDVLFKLAQAFDDGHGLTAVRFEGCYHASKPLLFEFGGYGKYLGKHYSLTMASHTPIHTAPRIDEALAANDTGQATELLLEQVERLLVGVKGDASDEIRKQLAARLARR